MWGAGGGQGPACLLSPQVRVRLPEVLLDGLEPSRDYVIWVQSLRGTEASEARGVRARTRECPLLGCGTPVPQAFHGVNDPGPHLVPPHPGHHPSFPHTLGEWWRRVPEALLCSAAPLATPRHLRFSDVSHDSARVSWDGTPRPVRQFRVSYVSSESGHSGQVRADPWGTPSPAELKHPQGAWALPPTFTAWSRGSPAKLTPQPREPQSGESGRTWV